MADVAEQRAKLGWPARVDSSGLATPSSLSEGTTGPLLFLIGWVRSDEEGAPGSS